MRSQYTWRCTAAVLLVVGVAACGAPEMELVDHEHSQLCLRPSGDAERLELVVGWDCAASNQELVGGECGLEVEEDEIRLTSRLVFRDAWSGDVNAMCYPSVLICDVHAPPEGEYQVVHGDRTEELSMPVDGQALDCEAVGFLEDQVEESKRFDAR